MKTKSKKEVKAMLLVTIFYEVDEFCKLFESDYKKILVKSGIQKRNRASQLSMSEVIAICIYFHHSGYKNFKQYYTNYVCRYLTSEFHDLVSYNRFIELKQKHLLPLAIFAQSKRGTCKGKSYVDSTALRVSHERRISSHKTFADLAQRGKTSVGWFYGFKLHFVVNAEGEILSSVLSPGNVADNNEKILTLLTKNIFGKIFGDKGYIVNAKLFEKFYSKGVQFITKLRSNMKNKLLSIEDKAFLKGRGLIETVVGILKEELSLEHSRHRSFYGFFSHVFSAIAAYSFRAKKPSLKRKFYPKLTVA